MKKIVLLIACLSLTSSAFAKKRSFGLGIIVGEPTGITGKYFFDQTQAVDFGISYSFDKFVYAYADYLKHFPHAFGKSSKFVYELAPYVGVGLGVGLDHDVLVAARIPLGIEWMIPRSQIGLFLELVPGLAVIPSTTFRFGGGIGVRFFF
ncbi:MAG: hypothetical protein CL678_10590 [Bdellovibrionaceae bacterium]|nr:hypothetical protein [Pseudobdellovibrionaceae bacterium]|tara:strand:+ start:185 stop:634 length:450 start_codon:yes stop_codon:yes gene_type:complete